MLKIDLGAGNLCSNKIDRYKRYLGNNYNPSDYIGVDIRQNSGVDKVCDFETEKLPFTDNSVDEIVTIHTLEHVHKLEHVIQECHRILKPNGSLLFMEHGLAPEIKIQKWQHRLTPGWKKIGGGCHLNRNIEELIQNAGFQFKDLKKKYIKGPKIAAFQYYGEAIKN